MSSHVEPPAADGVRPYRRSDRSGFLDLYEGVWNVRKGTEWFDWRFEANPYVDEVPMVVAERDGEIVGAEPCLAFRLRAGRETALAFQPADWMVHPDYRRQGVFTSMTERFVDRYADGPAALYFNFPSDAILPGLERFGWRVVDRVPTHYRVQNPSTLAVDKLPASAPSRVAPAVERTVSALAQSYLRLVDRRAESGSAARGPTDASIVRHDGVPVGTLTSLYDRAVPDRIHVRRDAAFYRWRFANPRWTTTTYVARRDADPVAALVACSETVRGTRTTAVLDALPLDGSAPLATYDALLGAVVADAADADVVKLGGGAIPSSVRRRHRFLPDDELPLSLLTETTTMAVRPASLDADRPWRFGDRRPSDPTAWTLGLAEQDVA